MKYIKTPVYEFDELNEKAKEKVIDREREVYFACMFEDDLHLWLFDSDKCPLNGSGVSIDSLKDLSYDLSNYQYDHVAFRQCTLDKDVLIEKSGADKIISRRLCATPMDVKDFVDNIYISWHFPYARDCFCSTGSVIVTSDENWEEAEEDIAYDLEEEVAECLTEYMHKLQRKLYDYLIDLTDNMSSDETITENLDPDMVYDQDGICYSVDEVEEE